MIEIKTQKVSKLNNDWSLKINFLIGSLYFKRIGNVHFMKIKEIYEKVKCRQILTSKGYPTVELDLITAIGTFRSSCPSGQSTGKKEAKVVLDHNEEYMGRSVHKALFNIKKIIVPRFETIFDLDTHDQQQIDEFLVKTDGTPNLSRLGANAILPLSMSFCRAAAESMNYQLWEYIAEDSSSTPKMPYPCFNIINGGAHAGNNLKFQEVMICFKEKSFADNLEKAVRVYDTLRRVIGTKYGSTATNVGDEGGFAPPIDTLEEALDLLIEAQKLAGAEGMGIVIDAASNEFYNNGIYMLQEPMDRMTYISYLNDIIKKYPSIFMLEDPFAEDDYESWSTFMKETNVLVMGDDLTVTNREHVMMAAEKNLCNAMLVKPNQIGTVTGTLMAIKEARKHKMKICVSHRSTETEDTFVSDLAVGVGADYVKFGAPCRGERVSKYNQLLRIEEKMKKKEKTK